jgi:hypothetical protein
VWADSLKAEEVESTLRAAEQLAGVAWAAPLLSRTNPILERLRIGLTDKVAYSANPLQPAEMSFLFEIRFARALMLAGLTAEYEHGAGVGNSTVDFRVGIDPPWLVELVSLHESDAFKAATWKSGDFQGFSLGTNPDDQRQSDAGETIKAQERIGAKTFERKQGPIKFPVPSGPTNVIMVDARGFLGDGHGDAADWHQIAFGPAGLEAHLVKHWVNPKTGKATPISGLFQPSCPLLAAPTVQERIHFIGFICERTFGENEIQERTFYCCNPALFENEAAARAAMERWPLKRASKQTAAIDEPDLL